MARWYNLYIIDLYKDGVFYASKSMNCGEAALELACNAWRRQGYEVRMNKTTNSKKGT